MEPVIHSSLVGCTIHASCSNSNLPTAPEIQVMSSFWTSSLLSFITAIAEQCFRLIPTRHVGLVEINIMPMLARPTCCMSSTRTCMCQHNVFRLVPTPPLQFLHELTVHGYMYTYALCYDTRHIMHALALPQPNPHQPPRLKDNCMEPVGVIFWLCWFPWFAFLFFNACRCSVAPKVPGGFALSGAQN